MKKKLIILGILLLITFSFINLGSNLKQEKINNVSVKQINEISYKGEAGKDALTILKQKFSVSQDSSGLVNGVGGRIADTATHEYWAFYVNGKASSVGPADYKTINSDLIEWKVEKY